MIEAVNYEELQEKGTFVFSPKEINKYDINLTKENVENLISEYKEAKFSLFASTKALETISMFYTPKFGKTINVAQDKIGDNVAKKIDSDNFIKSYDEVFNPLLETFSPDEKKYYLYCIANENSEQMLADLLGISRTGLQPIKNNCILKIGLAFQIAVKK